jgi:hypothetical protein
METLRLRKIQQPSQVERLLEAFVVRGKLLAKDFYQIRDPRALPSPLQLVVARAAAQEGRVWGCWASGHELWLFTCEMSLALSRERGAPVLQVNRYDEAGELTEAGTWAADRDGGWVRCID